MPSLGVKLQIDRALYPSPCLSTNALWSMELEGLPVQKHQN